MIFFQDTIALLLIFDEDLNSREARANPLRTLEGLLFVIE